MISRGKGAFSLCPRSTPLSYNKVPLMAAHFKAEWKLTPLLRTKPARHGMVCMGWGERSLCGGVPSKLPLRELKAGSLLSPHPLVWLGYKEVRHPIPLEKWSEWLAQFLCKSQLDQRDPAPQS